MCKVTIIEYRTERETAEAFFSKVRETSRKLDRGEPIEPGSSYVMHVTKDNISDIFGQPIPTNVERSRIEWAKLQEEPLTLTRVNDMTNHEHVHDEHCTHDHTDLLSSSEHKPLRGELKTMVTIDEAAFIETKEKAKIPGVTLSEEQQIERDRVLRVLMEEQSKKKLLDQSAMYKVNNQRKGRTLIRRTAKIGRNDPCSCKSGKKYKQCCLNLKTELT